MVVSLLPFPWLYPCLHGSCHVIKKRMLKRISNFLTPRPPLAAAYQALLTLRTTPTFVIEVVDVLGTWHSHHFAWHTFRPADNTIPLGKTKAICGRDTKIKRSH